MPISYFQNLKIKSSKLQDLNLLKLHNKYFSLLLTIPYQYTLFHNQNSHQLFVICKLTSKKIKSLTFFGNPSSTNRGGSLSSESRSCPSRAVGTP